MSIVISDGNESQPSTNYTSSAIYNAFPKQCPQPFRRFAYHEILSATEYFAESLVIGRQGCGTVYKGSLFNGSNMVVAAIKRLDSSANNRELSKLYAFSAEVQTFSKLRHTHLVSLIGFCDYGKEMLLVYEYIDSRTLDEHLHGLSTYLSWDQRLKICIGAASALEYLHTGWGLEFGIRHGNVKSSNILLNQSWVPKISDFGYSKILPRDQNFTKYVDTDVYAFGVVLFEVLTRRTAQQSIKKGSLMHLIDSDIRDEISPKCLKGFVQIAERCLDNNTEHRPTMAEVVSTLENVLSQQQKTNNLLQAAGKRVFGRHANMFLITTYNNNSGMENEFRMPKKRKLLTLRDKILQQNGALSSKKVSTKIHRLKPSCFGSIRLFGAKELEKATNSYAEDRILGKGAQGIVYKGILPDKRVVAIKILRIQSQSRLEQFITEIAILEQINHKNVVQLLGCCFKTEGAVLVYEFVPNGTLHHLIHNETSGAMRLSWDSRLRIAHESADALAYLHTYDTISIVHRDVKSANILLDENYTVKISDFGSSRLSPLNHGQLHVEVEGTLGYMDPEYYDTCQLTCKTDVYGFGVVLAELLTGKKPIDRNRDDDIRLSTYFVKETKESRLREIVDPQLLGEATDEQLIAACDLVYRCLERLGENRPNMKEVTVELETIRNLGSHPSACEATSLVQKIEQC